MIYECLVCGELVRIDTQAGRAGQGDSHITCPTCHSEDLEPIWDEEDPPTSPEEFGIKEAK